MWDGEGAGAVIDGLALMDSLTELLLSALSPGERLGGTYPCLQSYFSVVQMGFVHKCECKKHSLFSRSDGAAQSRGDKSCSGGSLWISRHLQRASSSLPALVTLNLKSFYTALTCIA